MENMNDELFFRITDSEKDAICKYIIDNAGAGGGCLNGDWETLPLRRILRYWNKNKSLYAPMFGDKLIMSRMVSYDKPENELLEEMDRVLFYDRKHNFRDFFNQWQAMEDEECGPRTWKWDDPLEQKRSALEALFSSRSMVKGFYDGDPISITDNNTGKEIIIPTGCKIMKAIGKIVKAKNMSREQFEELRIAQSLVVNQKKLHGELCLSIHPLDFMTMSDNNCDWSSCMNWPDGGEYRQGTVEMMNSKYVVIAYLRSAEHPFYPVGGDFVWSNKKWRQLFVVTPEVIMGIKAYPYQNDTCTEAAIKWLKELAEKAGVGMYGDKVERLNNEYRSVLSDGREVNFCFNMHHMYNDIDSNHMGFVSNDVHDKDNISIMLSGETECMKCGQNMSDFYDEYDAGSLACEACDEIFRCAGCGDIIYSSDDWYWLDGEKYCSSCYDCEGAFCPCCEEMHHRDNFTSIEITFDNENEADDSPEISICDDCYNNSTVFGEFYSVKSSPRSHRWWSGYVKAVNPKNFSEEGKEIFNQDIDFDDYIADYAPSDYMIS